MCDAEMSAIFSYRASAYSCQPRWSQLFRGWAAQSLMRLVHLRQQCDVRHAVTCRVDPSTPLPGPDCTVFRILANQTRHLRPAQACRLADVLLHQTFVHLPKEMVFLPAQRPFRPFIKFLPAR